METIIIHHPARPEPARLLAEFPDAHVMVDIEGRGAPGMHMAAIQAAADLAAETGERALIVEDDAIPVQGAGAMVEEFLGGRGQGLPLVSFYLGAGAPVDKQIVIQAAVNRARNMGGGLVRLPALYHAVSYSIRPDRAGRIVEALHASAAIMGGFPANWPIDRLIGQAAGETWYWQPSLFDHDDDLPSTVPHQGPRPEPGSRRAHWLAGNKAKPKEDQ